MGLLRHQIFKSAGREGFNSGWHRSIIAKCPQALVIVRHFIVISRFMAIFEATKGLGPVDIQCRYRYTRVSVTLAAESAAMTMPVPCVNCLKPFIPKRVTAKFCGGTCRQQWRRKQQKTLGTKVNIDAVIKADIGSVYRAVTAFVDKYRLSDFAGADTAPLEDALATLGDLFNCEYCDTRRADGWDNFELCRRCEIQIFKLVCRQCETRKPSVQSDDQLCRQCIG